MHGGARGVRGWMGSVVGGTLGMGHVVLYKRDVSGGKSQLSNSTSRIPIYLPKAAKGKIPFVVADVESLSVMATCCEPKHFLSIEVQHSLRREASFTSNEAAFRASQAGHAA